MEVFKWIPKEFLLLKLKKKRKKNHFGKNQRTYLEHNQRKRCLVYNLLLKF